MTRALSPSLPPFLDLIFILHQGEAPAEPAEENGVTGAGGAWAGRPRGEPEAALSRAIIEHPAWIQTGEAPAGIRSCWGAPGGRSPPLEGAWPSA